MHAFKSISVLAVFLLALMQGAVAQNDDLVPLGGQCETIIGTVRLSCLCVDFSWLIPAVPPPAIQKPCAVGKCCILNPDNGICMLKCPYTTA
ncbi:hypothetical protein B0H19DRAFT_1151786 [Mycena capillaripes]|nr:hypothetical protein B0H19DRAFT_1151786 [Mycena capillaripes]